MSELDPRYSHDLMAASGWLELGNPREARLELARLPEALREHPDVLEVLWEICAAESNWEEGVRHAEALVRGHPERCSGWIHRAYALRRASDGGLDKAWQALRPAMELFPEEAVVPYNLACYAAQFGRLEEAWDWLEQAMERSGESQTIRKMALADTDLQELWPRLRETK